MLRGYFRIEDRDSEGSHAKIAGRLLLLDPDFADDLPRLRLSRRARSGAPRPRSAPGAAGASFEV
jgi:hypothetical protein